MIPIYVCKTIKAIHTMQRLRRGSCTVGPCDAHGRAQAQEGTKPRKGTVPTTCGSVLGFIYVPGRRRNGLTAGSMTSLTISILCLKKREIWSKYGKILRFNKAGGDHAQMFILSLSMFYVLRIWPLKWGGHSSWSLSPATLPSHWPESA